MKKLIKTETEYGPGDRTDPQIRKNFGATDSVGIADAMIKLLEANNMSISYNRHSVGGSNFHLQFTPKRRRIVFKYPKIRFFIKKCFEEKALMLGVTLATLEFGPEHVHLFLEDCKNYSVSKLVQHFKGYSSRMVRKEFWDLLQERHPGNAFWTPGNFHESIGRVTSDNVIFYIERQQKKHWQHITHEEYSPTQKKLPPKQSRLTMFAN